MIKDIFQIKRLVITAIVIFLAGYWFWTFSAPAQFGATPPSFFADGRTITFEWTDDNTKEDLIIYSDKKTYSGIYSSTAYFSVTNNSGQGQNVELSLTSTKAQLNEVYSYGGEETYWYNDPRVIESEIITATGTKKIHTEVIEKKQGTRTKWNELVKSDGRISKEEPDIKAVKGSSYKKTGSVFINTGETAFFKARILNKDIKNSEEFFVEAFGDKGGYGHLDPIQETIEDFEALTAGDLTGQNGWSGNACYDVATDQFNGGAQSGKYNSCGSSVVIDKDISLADNTLTYYFRIADTSSNERIQQRVMTDDNATILFRLNWAAGTLKLNTIGYSAEQTVGTYTADAWHKIEVTTSATDDTVAAEINDGGFTTAIAVNGGTFSNPQNFRLYNDAAGTAAWIDDISADTGIAPITYRHPGAIIIDTGD